MICWLDMIRKLREWKNAKTERNLAKSVPIDKEQKMRTNFIFTNFSNTPRGPGHPGRTFGTSQVPPFETQGRQTFEGGHELFGLHPFAWRTPTSQDHGKGGLSLRGVAVMTETAMTAETVKTATVASLCCIL